MNEQRISRVQPGFVLSWLLLLASAYMLTYSATPQSTDTLRIFDAASSLARYGDIARDETIWIEAPQDFGTGLPYPIIFYETGEPLAVWAAAALYAVADVLPGFGFAHVTWLLNIIVGLCVAAVFYAYTRQLGYSPMMSTFGSLLLGAGTGLWVYTTTLFREPLVILWLLLTALAVERWRVRLSFAGMLWLLAAALAFALAYLTKNSAVFALPGLVILALPRLEAADSRLLRRTCDGLLLAALVVFFAAIVSEAVYQLLITVGEPLLRRMGANPEFGRVALHTYLLSVGGSIWGTAPVLVLGLPGAWLLLRAGQRRLIWGSVAILAGYAVGHALLTGVHWFGGLSWPPRFLIPVLPFAMMLVLPALRWLEQRRGNYWLKGMALLLIVYSVAIQVIGAVSFFGTYVEYLPPEANGLYEWLPGLNTVEYLRWVVLPQTWGSVGLDTAWSRIGSEVIPLMYILLMVGALVLLIGRRASWLRGGAAAGWLLFTVTTLFGLRTLYASDPLFWADKQALFDVLGIVAEEAEGGEPLLLADNTYSRFIHNYYDLDNARPVVFGFQPGEAPSDIAPPRIVSDYPPELVELYVPRAVDFLASHHERIWLLAPNSEFLPWAVRPVERYMGENYYLIRDVRTDDPTVRLLLYSTTPAPNRYELRLPEHSTDLRFGDSIDLLGFSLPEGALYTPGEVVPITFFWQAQDSVSQDYVVAWFLVADSEPSAPIQGQDSRPDAGFRSTLTWAAGEIIYDNRALQLPEELPAGEYQVWVLLYEASSGGANRLPVVGAETLEGEIGVLPLRIEIHAN